MIATEELLVGLALTQMTAVETWIAYAASGGSLSEGELNSFIGGLCSWELMDISILSIAINEKLWDQGNNFRIDEQYPA